jgi:CDP-diacylglycerol--glycerol-3-phosphate 3-phosphatidyltransferase
MLDNSRARAVMAAVIEPVSKGLLALGISADVVTIVGGVGAATAALVFYPMGHLFVGSLVVTLFVFSDLLDGTMARLAGRSGPWGGFLDSTLDRVTDAAITGGLLIYLVRHHDIAWVAAFIALVGGFLVSYTRARAEAAGLKCEVGIAERAERLIISLAAAGFTGLGLHWLLAVGMWTLAALSVATVCQRILTVYQQTHSPEAA